MTGLVVINSDEQTEQTWTVDGGPPASKLLIADWGDTSIHLSLIKPVIFKILIANLSPHLVNLPLILLCTQREYEGSGGTRAIRGIHAARFTGDPRLRPVISDAHVLIREYNIETREGRLVRRPWVEHWLVDRLKTLKKDDDCADF